MGLRPFDTRDAFEGGLEGEMNRFGEGMKLFVGNMPSGASERKLRDIFEAFGPVGECSILEDRGYGFVHFVSSEDAREAVSKLNGAEFEGSRMSVEISHSRPGRGRFTSGRHSRSPRRDGTRDSGAYGYSRDVQSDRSYDRPRGGRGQQSYDRRQFGGDRQSRGGFSGRGGYRGNQYGGYSDRNGGRSDENGGYNGRSYQQRFDYQDDFGNRSQQHSSGVKQRDHYGSRDQQQDHYGSRHQQRDHYGSRNERREPYSERDQLWSSEQYGDRDQQRSSGQYSGYSRRGGYQRGNRFGDSSSFRDRQRSEQFGGYAEQDRQKSYSSSEYSEQQDYSEKSRYNSGSDSWDSFIERRFRSRSPQRDSGGSRGGGRSDYYSSNDRQDKYQQNSYTRDADRNRESYSTNSRK